MRARRVCSGRKLDDCCKGKRGPTEDSLLKPKDDNGEEKVTGSGANVFGDPINCAACTLVIALTSR